MDGKKSKFDYAIFQGEGQLAVNKAKYTEQEAIDILKYEKEGVIGTKKSEYMLINGYVKWRAGVDGDGERAVGYWLEWAERKRGSVECYVFEQRWKDE